MKRYQTLLDRDKLAGLADKVGNYPIAKCKESIVAPYANPLPCPNARADLADDDVASYDPLASKFFEAAALAWSPALLGGGASGFDV